MEQGHEEGGVLLVLLLAATTLRATAGLLVHLPFDRDGTDASGEKHHSQEHNGMAIDPQHFKLGGVSVTFNGKAAFYNIPAYTPVLSNRVRSVSFWERSETSSKFKPNKIFLGWGNYGGYKGIRCNICLE